ncbi:nucleoside triphosphate pyrophosphohydrolase [Sporosarcina sp. FSL K6-1508]|uniref:nucleoside triphosphate pyrophosphohydrolase n=1 Tax=Sporosarcina sp. FSL K6-1508 TaxID=2921553 RepID=UPI0030F59A37
MPIYNKLVRDRIPEIIEKSGQTCNTRLLDEDEYIIEINKKMYEEMEEYEAAETTDDAIEELADLLELIHAALSHYGASFEDLEKVRVEKAEKRGGFDDQIYLMNVEEDDS